MQAYHGSSRNVRWPEAEHDTDINIPYDNWRVIHIWLTEFDGSMTHRANQIVNFQYFNIFL